MRMQANEQELFELARTLPLEIEMTQVAAMVQSLPQSSGSSIFTSKVYLNALIGTTLAGAALVAAIALWPADTSSSKASGTMPTPPRMELESLVALMPSDTDSVSVTGRASVEISKTVGQKSVKLSQEVSATTVTLAGSVSTPLPGVVVTKMVNDTDAEVERLLPNEPEEIIPWETEETEEWEALEETEEWEASEVDWEEEPESEDWEEEPEAPEFECELCAHCNQAFIEDEDEVSFTVYCLRPGSATLKKSQLSKFKRKLERLASKEGHLEKGWTGLNIAYSRDRIVVDGEVLSGEQAEKYAALFLRHDVRPGEYRRILLGKNQIWVGDIVDGRFTGSAHGSHVDTRFVDDQMNIRPPEDGGLEMQ